MKQTVRFLSVLLAVFTVLPVLASCSGTPVASDTTGITETETETEDSTMPETKPTPVTTPDKVRTKMLMVAAGAWTRGGSYSSVHQTVTDGYLECKTSGNRGDNTYRNVFLTFNIGNLEPEDIGSAKLSLTCSSSAELRFNVYLVDADAWDASTITHANMPAGTLLFKSVPLFNSISVPDFADAIRGELEAGKKKFSIRIESVTVTEGQLKFSFSSTDKPKFTISNIATEGSYTKVFSVGKEESEKIWTYAQGLYDEWTVRYEEMKAKPLADANTITPDASQYTKTVKASGQSTSYSSAKSYKTRTYGALTDLDKYTDASATYERDEYGGWKNESMKQTATGFFRTAKIDGRWWLIDPIGYPFISVGLSDINYSQLGSKLQSQSVLDLYGSYANWALSTTRHLQNDLGFNSTARSLAEIRNVSTPLNSLIPLTKNTSNPIGAGLMTSYASAIGVRASGPNGDSMPVFDPAFVTYADGFMKAAVAPYKGNANIIGFMSDNELPLQLTLLDKCLSADISQIGNLYTYACAWTFLVNITSKEAPTDDDITDEIRDIFRGFAWDRYYKVATEALRKYDNEHLYIGTRYLYYIKDSEWVCRVSGYYLDAFTVNYYHAWEAEVADLADICRYSGLPFIVTEWYAKAGENEGNLANTAGAGFYVATQQDRADYYQNFTLRLAECPNCVGWEWFQYMDNDPNNKTSDTSSTNSNKGLYSNTAKEYTVLGNAMAEINQNIYRLAGYFDKKAGR